MLIKKRRSLRLFYFCDIPAFSSTAALLSGSQSLCLLDTPYSLLSSIFSTLRIPASYESRQHALQSRSMVASIQCPSCTPSCAKRASKERVCRNNFIVSIAGSLVIAPPIPQSTIAKRPGKRQTITTHSVGTLLDLQKETCTVTSERQRRPR